MQLMREEIHQGLRVVAFVIAVFVGLPAIVLAAIVCLLVFMGFGKKDAPAQSAPCPCRCCGCREVPR